MGLTQALNISASALGVHQSVINVLSNNIANMNTQGYSRQKANLGTMVLGLPIGNSVANQVKTSAGVELINVQRYTKSIDDSYYYSQLGEQAKLNEKMQGLDDIVRLFDDLQGQGLDSSLSAFYKALNSLNQYPTDPAIRINFLDAAETLTNSMNKISSNLEALKGQKLGDGESLESLQNSKFYSNVVSLNTGLSDLVAINKQIANSQTGNLDNNNLLDRRDALLKDLSQYADFTVDINSNGTVNLSLGSVKLVAGSELKGQLDVQTAKQYDDYCKATGIENTNTSNAVLMIKKTDGSVIQNVNNKVSSGTLGAMLSGSETSDAQIDGVIGSLDKIAQTVANVFNNLQTRQGAFYLDYSSGKVQLSNDNLEIYTIFNSNDGSDITAGNITINSLLKEEGGYNKIAAAFIEGYDPTDPGSVDKNAVGNSNNIIAMIATQSDASGTDFEPLGHLTFGDYYNSILAKVSSGLSTAESAKEAQDAVVNSIENKISSETSVDLNEELTDIVKTQTAYSASARVFSVCNSLLDTLINLGL